MNHPIKSLIKAHCGNVLAHDIRKCAHVISYIGNVFVTSYSDSVVLDAQEGNVYVNGKIARNHSLFNVVDNKTGNFR